MESGLEQRSDPRAVFRRWTHRVLPGFDHGSGLRTKGGYLHDVSPSVAVSAWVRAIRSRFATLHVQQ